MPTKLQKHPALGTFLTCTCKGELIQSSSQHALKASHMSASEAKMFKNRNNLVGSEDRTHCQISQPLCFLCKISEHLPTEIAKGTLHNQLSKEEGLFHHFLSFNVEISH